MPTPRSVAIAAALGLLAPAATRGGELEMDLVLSGMEGTWNWVSTAHPWGPYQTPATEGYNEQWIIYRTVGLSGSIARHRDGELIALMNFEICYPNYPWVSVCIPDLHRSTSLIPAFRQDFLMLDGTMVDAAPLYTFQRDAKVSSSERSIGWLRARY